MKVNNKITRRQGTNLLAVSASLMMTASIVGCSILGNPNTSESTISETVPVTLATMSTETEPIVETDAPVETTEPVPDFAMEFVNMIYQNILGREATSEELDVYAPALKNESISVPSFITALINSEEFIALDYSDSDFVNLCYRTFMRTIPDMELQSYWVNILTTGVSRSDVAIEFMSSPEFGEICSGYGLLPNIGSEATPVDSPREAVEAVVAENNIVGIGGYVPSAYTISEIESSMSDLRSRGFHLGFVVVDMQTGRGICYNPDEDFYTASSIKGPFAISLAAYNPDAAMARENSILSMLMYSDNDAYTALNDSYRRTYIQQWCEESGVDPAPCVYKYPHLSSRQLALMWIHAYDYFENDEFGATVGTWFEAPTYSLIHSELGDMYVTRSKAGWVADDNPSHTTTVDAGIVYADNGDYVVVIMSNYPSSIEPLRPLMQALNNAHNEM